MAGGSMESPALSQVGPTGVLWQARHLLPMCSEVWRMRSEKHALCQCWPSVSSAEWAPAGWWPFPVGRPKKRGGVFLPGCISVTFLRTVGFKDMVLVTT